jgi:hypothetical protein
MVTADRLLPDTCAWIDFFNARPTPLAMALENALRRGAIYTCGVVKFELVQGLKGRDEERILFAALQAVPHLELTESLWINAGRLSRRLRKQGTTIPLSDILIATLALEHNLSVLTVDRHFSQVVGLLVVAG